MDSLLIALLLAVLSSFGGLGARSPHIGGNTEDGVITGMTPEYLDEPAADDPLYDQWMNRENLADCGFIAPGFVSTDDTFGSSGWECMEAARARGVGGEMVRQLLTREGDPTTVWHRITPEGTYETYTDPAPDAPGSAPWEYTECSKPGKVLERQRCQG